MRKMSDVIITSYNLSQTNASDVLPTEEVTFNYSKIEIEYTAQKPDGSKGAPVKAGWDLKQNKGV